MGAIPKTSIKMYRVCFLFCHGGRKHWAFAPPSPSGLIYHGEGVYSPNGNVILTSHAWLPLDLGRLHPHPRTYVCWDGRLPPFRMPP